MKLKIKKRYSKERCSIELYIHKLIDKCYSVVKQNRYFFVLVKLVNQIRLLYLIIQIVESGFISHPILNNLIFYLELNFILSNIQYRLIWKCPKLNVTQT
jgi:hypothetical protein